LVRQGGKLLWTSTATLQGMVWRASEKLAAEEQAILQRLRRAPFVHVDESILRVDGRREWFWVFVTEEDLLLVVRPSRSREVVEEVLGKDYAGRIVCDGWKSYWGWVLQRCWAHLLRYAKAGSEESEEGKELYGALCALHEELTQDVKEVSRRTLARRLRKGERVLQELLGRFGKSEASGVAKVMTYLRNGIPWWLTFLKNPGMDATNNRDERGLREAIVIRKIIGTLRNWTGAEAFARLLSVRGTWKLRGGNPTAKLYAALS